MTVSPRVASTKAVRRPVTMKLTTGTRDTTGAQIPPTSKVTLLFPKGARWNGGLFPTCSASTISASKTTEDCPTGSFVGSGRVIGSANGGKLRQDDVKVTIVNGGARSLNMFIEGAQPLRIQSNVVVKISQASGQYALKTTINVPEVLQVPSQGVEAGIERFEMTISGSRKVNGKRRGLMEMDRCDDGKWFGEGSFEYRTGLKLSAGREIPCKKG